MAIVSVRDLGKFGIVKDSGETEIPLEAWSHGRNVSFIDGFVTPSLGETDVEGTPTVVPYFVFPAPTPGVAYWAYTDTDKVYAVAGGTHTDITRAAGDYTGGLDDKWSGGWLNGVLILCNGKDAPQQWLPISPSQDLIALANFTTTGVTTLRAKVIRPFKNFLIALDMTKDSIRYPTSVMWSHPADPGTVPVSWDLQDASKLTGEQPLSETPGFLIDCAPLGIANIVYKEDAVIRMERVQSNAIFAFTSISDRTGLMSVDCAKPFIPGLQVFLTADATVATTDGRQIQEVSDRYTRRYLQQTIDNINRKRCFVFVDYARKLAYICYPTNGKSFCNEAAIWNFVDNTWSFRALSDTLDIKTGFYDQNQNLRRWSDQTAVPWSSMNEPWDIRAYQVGVYKPIGAFPAANRLREVNRGTLLGATAYESYVERRGLAIVGKAQDGSPRVDLSSIKLISRVRPLVRASVPVTIKVEVGSQATADGPISWQGPFMYNTADGLAVEPLSSGRFNALRFTGSPTIDWKLYGYDMEVNVLGAY